MTVDCQLSTPAAASQDCSFTSVDGPKIADYHPSCYEGTTCSEYTPTEGADTLPMTGSELWLLLVLTAAALLTVGALLVRWAARKAERDWLHAATTMREQYERRPS